MSSSHALCCLPSVKKRKHDFHFHFVQCVVIKQLLFDSIFVTFRIIKVLVRVISLSLLLRLITPCSTLIILNKIIIKTSSNNIVYNSLQLHILEIYINVYISHNISLNKSGNISAIFTLKSIIKEY